MTVSFYYLRGVFYDSPELQEQHEQRILKLLNGDIGKDQIEPLEYGIWSLRLTLKERLLFTIEEVKEESYLSVLEYLPNHEYHRSRFLQSGVLTAYQKKNKTLYAQLVDQSKAVQEQAKQKMLDALKATYKKMGKDGRPQVLEFYQSQLLILTPLQQDALALRLPAVLSGVAGSGKSVIALTAIADYVTTNSPSPGAIYKVPRRRILYISKSDALVQQNKRFWKELPASINPPHTVDFISLDFLIQEGLNNGLILTSEEFFNTFCYQYFSEQNKKYHTNLEINYKKIREEFLICSGHDKERYLELGLKQSTVDKEVREVYYSAYQAYLRHLKAKNQLDPDFYPLELDKYDLIVMDEAQDLSHHAINSIHAKANKESILYCMDSHQRLGSNKSIRPYLLNKIGNDPRRHVTLVSTHRCPVKVVNAANEALTFKQLMVDGIADKYETPNIQSVAAEKGLGSVYVCDEQSLLSLPWMAQAKQSYFVVITSKKNCENPETLAAIKKRFNTTNVLSPEQAKGLEYDVVLTYDLYDEEVFRSLKDKIQTLDEESKPSSHQPKTSTGREECTSFFNGIYTSYTRAKTALIVCEKQTHLNKPLLDKIKKGMDAGLPPEDLFSKVSTKEDWQLEVTRQLEAGNESLAKNTYLNHLVTNKEEQEQEYETFVRALHAKANPPVTPKLGKNQRNSLFEEKKEFKAKNAGIAQEKVLLVHASKPLATKQAPPKAKPMGNLKKKDTNPEEIILFKAMQKLQEAVNNKKDLKLFFRELLTFFGEQSREIAIKAHPLDFKKWGAFRNADKEHTWCHFTGLYSQYEKLNSPLLSKLQKHLKTMKYSKERFIKSELKIPGKTCCGRKTSLDIEVLPGEDAEQWAFTGFPVSEMRRISELCGINTAELTDANVTKQYNNLIDDKVAMARLKSQSIRDYSRINMYQIIRLIKEMEIFKDYRKTDFVLATVRMEINGKMLPLTQYVTWMHRTLEDDPIDYMTGRSIVFLIHQEYSLIDTVLEDIASLFKEVIEWDGTVLQTLINNMTFINYEFAHAMPFKAGSKDIGKWLEKLLYHYHELELKKKVNTDTEMDMFTYSLEEYSKIYCSDLAFEQGPQYSQPFESKNVPMIQSAVKNPLVMHAPRPNLSTFLVNNLFKEFNEINFMNLMRQKKADIKPLHEIIYKIADKETTLLEFIEENPGRKTVFLKWVANNLFILAKINLETPNISSPTPFMQDLNQLAPIQKFLKLSELEHEQFKELISKNPAQELLRVYRQSTQKDLSENNHITYLQVLTSMGADLNQVEKGDGTKLLHQAVLLEDFEVFLFLHEQHIDLSEPNPDGLTIAHFAAQSASLKILTWINNNPKLKHLLGLKSNAGITPAYILAEEGYCSTLKELNQWGLDLNVPVEFLGMKPVHVAASQGHVEVLQLFQSLGLLEEPTEFEDANGITPLMIGALAGQIEVVRFLITMGVQVDKKCLISYEKIKCLLKDSPPLIRQNIISDFEKTRQMMCLGSNTALPWDARDIAMMVGHKDIDLLIAGAQDIQRSNHNESVALGNQQGISQQQGQFPQKITGARSLLFNKVPISPPPLNAAGIDCKV